MLSFDHNNESEVGHIVEPKVKRYTSSVRFQTDKIRRHYINLAWRSMQNISKNWHRYSINRIRRKSVQRLEIPTCRVYTFPIFARLTARAVSHRTVFSSADSGINRSVFSNSLTFSVTLFQQSAVDCHRVHIISLYTTFSNLVQV
ncbi:hypothetical protein ACS0PU_012015 [Formica fusca]